jgi:hypothetical protein
VDSWWLLAVLEKSLWCSAGSLGEESILLGEVGFLDGLSDILLLGLGKFVSLVKSPGILDGSP